MMGTSSAIAVGQAEWLAVRTMADLRALAGRLPPPVVVFNKSHSGSRLLATLLKDAGLFIGSVRNESGDALPLLDLVEHCVGTHYPDYAVLFGDGPESDATAQVAARALAAHLAGHGAGPWAGSSASRLYPAAAGPYFPDLRAIHLIRDGRDVAFANHVPPSKPFWQKVYVNAEGVGRWNGLFFGATRARTYRLYPYLYNIQHWMNAVTVGGVLAPCSAPAIAKRATRRSAAIFDGEARRVLDFAGLGDCASAIVGVKADVSAGAGSAGCDARRSGRSGR